MLLAHGDIKPDNFAITNDFKLALTEFVCSEPFYELVQKSNTGTKQYNPKEVNPDFPFRLAYADIYSLALTILVIITSDMPFAKIEREELDEIYEKPGTKDYFLNKIYLGKVIEGHERHP